MARPVVNGLSHATPRRPWGAPPRRLRESSAFPLSLAYPGWGGFDNPWSDPAFGGWGGHVWGVPRERTGPDKSAPLSMLTEVEWRGSILLARWITERIDLAVGFLGHVANFVVGDGYTWKVTLRGQSTGAVVTGLADRDGDGQPDADPAVRRCQQFLDEWQQFAGWGEGAGRFYPEDLDGEDSSPTADRERECVIRGSRDGNTLLRFFAGGAGDDYLPSVREVEPECLRTPTEKASWKADAIDWRWGVGTDPADPQRRLGYWLCDPDDPSQGEVVPAGRIVHFKANVDGCIKVGISDFLPVGEALRNVRDILANIGETTKALSRYMWITEQAPGVSRESILNLIDAGKTHEAPVIYPPSFGGGTSGVSSVPTKQLTGPTIEHTSSGTKVGAVPATQSESFIATVQAKLRAMGTRFGSPEYFSGDASNANYASTQVAGGPFERAVKARQKDVRRFHQQVAMKVLAFGVQAGRISRDDYEKITMTVTAPAVAIADKLQDTQRRQILNQSKVLSPQTWASQEDLDPNVEGPNLKAWQQQFPDPGGGGGFGGGGFGGGGDDSPAPPDSELGDSFAALYGEGVKLSESSPIGPPPFPGAVFDRSRHRWVNPHTGEDHGNKAVRLSVKALAGAATAQLRMARQADAAGDTEAGRRHRAAAYGYNRAAKKLEDGDKKAAKASASLAGEFAAGVRELKGPAETGRGKAAEGIGPPPFPGGVPDA